MASGKIQINTGTFTADTCVTENDLIINSAKFPAVRNMLEYVQKRAISALIASGGVTPYGVENPKKAKMGKISESKGIGNNGYRYDVMGRIEKASEILSQVGASGADGTFTLRMNDRHLWPGAVVMFNGQRLQARVMTSPGGSQASGWTYTFKTMDGSTFSYATAVNGQSGTKTCMPIYSAYGEKSLRGYGRSKFPDTFINFMTTQRKTCAITGGAASDVLWYTYTNQDGAMTKGWMFQELAQARVTFLYENERQKWFGVSNMKNSDGSVKAVPDMFDTETGMPITTGDGWEMQVAGGNVLLGSNADGSWSLQDLTDLMAMMEQQSDEVYGISWVGITGTRGYALVQAYAAQLAGNQNATFYQAVNQDGRAGGAVVDSGYEFQKLNIAGNSIMFIKHTLFDDRLQFTELDADGWPLQSSTVFIMNAGKGDKMNMEILHKEANGINRANVTAKLNGMTGSTEVEVTSEEDAMKYAMLKEDMFVVYNTNDCGILRKQAV